MLLSCGSSRICILVTFGSSFCLCFVGSVVVFGSSVRVSFFRGEIRDIKCKTGQPTEQRVARHQQVAQEVRHGVDPRVLAVVA